MERKDIPIPYSGQAARNNIKPASPKKYSQGYFKPKSCRMCNSMFTPIAPSEHYCSDVCKDEALADKYLKRTYGISIENYRDLYITQNGKCAICNEDGLRRAASANSKVGLVVDHNHITSDVRGLLCHTCNSALGQFKDSQHLLEEAIKYLKAPTPIVDLPTIKIKSRVNDLSADKHLIILEDHLDNGLNRKALAAKYDITDAKVRGIIEVRTEQAKAAHKRYYLLKESATTIETQETEEVEYVQVDGSGLASIDA